MNLLPVIQHELRDTSRKSATYWLRVGGAAAALFTIVSFAWEALQGSYRDSGSEVFVLVHRVVFFGIWLGVPWLVGDSISRERREGTLGLLFLTSLQPHEIVLAKVLVHGLRALTLWLATIPVMSLAFFLGGVGWLDALLSVAVNLSAMSLALAAGLLASSLFRRWLRAMVLATCLSLLMMICAINLWGSASALMDYRFSPVMIGSVFAPGQSAWFGGMRPNQLWVTQTGATTTVAGMASPFSTLSTRLGLSLLILTGALLLAARRVRTCWQEVPPPIWVQQVNAVFCKPRYFRRTFKRWMKWQIERNPIGWLEQRVWTSRLVVWSWFAVIVGVYSGVFRSARIYMQVFERVQLVLSSVLMLFVCTSAAGSFQRERETGVLELLLVSPVSEGRIIGGRLRALWGRFLPATLLLVLIWMTFPRVFNNHAPMPGAMFLLSSFATLPVIGLYQSLLRHHFFTALLWTIALGVVLPFLISGAAEILYALAGQTGVPGSSGYGYFWMAIRMLLASFLQVCIAAGCGYHLHRNLMQRRFALERADGG